MTRPPNVLFITDNGHGLGHLTRMMAVATRAGDRFLPIFLTMSEAFPVVRQMGWPAEYLPSYKKLGMTKAQWGPVFASRLVALLEHIRPRAVVIDHIFPSRVLSDIRAASQGIDFIWSRRGMWREGRNIEAMECADSFDVIVEPRDVAGPIDIGMTTERFRDVTFVAPVVLVDPREQMDRDQARQSLGIPLEGRAVLINLSDSDVVKLSSLIRQVGDEVASLTDGEQVHLFAPLHALHRDAISVVEGVTMRPVYPVAMYLKAFDGVVSTAGYNSFHEVLNSGMPGVFVARDADAVDDQERRARFAELSGVGYFAPSVDDPSFRTALQRMLAPDALDITARVTRKLGAFEGGQQFADVIAMRCESRARQPFVVAPDLRNCGPNLELLEGVISGRRDRGKAEPQAERVAVIALGFDQALLAHHVAQIAAIQEAVGGFKPVFLIDDVDTGPLDTFGFQYESIMTPSEYAGAGSRPYDEYVESCVEGLRSRYKPARVVTLRSDTTVQPGLLVGGTT